MCIFVVFFFFHFFFQRHRTPTKVSGLSLLVQSGAVCCGDDTVTQARFNYRMGSSDGLAQIHCVPVCDGDQ